MFMNGDTMVTKTKRPASSASTAASKRAPTRKRATPSSVAETASAQGAGPIPSAPAEPAKPNLLRAGLQALGNVRNDVVQHQSRVFEAILGIDPGQGWSGLMKRDTAAAKVIEKA